MAKPKRWRKQEARDWLTRFHNKHGVIPSTVLREKNTPRGPSDMELVRLFGSTQEAMKQAGIHLDPREVGHAATLIWKPNSLTAHEQRAEREKARLEAQILTTTCAWCGDSYTGNALETHAWARQHREEQHAVKGKDKQRWRNPSGPGSVPGQVPGT